MLASGQLEGRKECCAMLSDTWHGAKKQVDNWDGFAQISLALWSELAEPGARREDDSEAKLFWKHLCSMKPAFAGGVLLFLKQKRYDIESKSRPRERYNNACHAIFRRQFEAEIISHMTEEFGNPC